MLFFKSAIAFLLPTTLPMTTSLTLSQLQQRAVHRIAVLEREQVEIKEKIEALCSDPKLSCEELEHSASVLQSKSYFVYGQLKGIKLALGID